MRGLPFQFQSTAKAAKHIQVCFIFHIIHEGRQIDLSSMPVCSLYSYGGLAASFFINLFLHCLNVNI